MKRINITSGLAALVLRNREYVRCLTSGMHWVKFDADLRLYDMTKEFSPSIDLNVLIKDPALLELLHIVDVSDGELVFVFKAGVFDKVLKAGRYAFWKNVINYSFVKCALSETFVPERLSRAVLKRDDMKDLVRSISVGPFETAVLFVNHRMTCTLEPGEYFFWKDGHEVSIEKCDMRPRLRSGLSAKALTNDSFEVLIHYNLSLRIVNVEEYLNSGMNDKGYFLSQLRLCIAKELELLSLDDLHSKKIVVQQIIQSTLRIFLLESGVSLCHFEIIEIFAIGHIDEAMNGMNSSLMTGVERHLVNENQQKSDRSLINIKRPLGNYKMLSRLGRTNYTEGSKSMRERPMLETVTIWLMNGLRYFLF